MSCDNQIPTRAPSLLILLGIITGLSLARQVTAPIAWTLAIAILLTALSLRWCTQQRLLWLVSFITAATLTAWAYGSLRLPAKPPVELLERPIREAHLDLKVERIMQARNNYGKSTGIGRILQASATSRLQPGDQIFFSLERSPKEHFEISRGCAIRATGVLTPISPHVAPDSFESYLSSTGIHYRFERTSGLERLQAPSQFDQFCQRMNTRFQNYLRLGAPTESGIDSIYVAMLLGRKTELNSAQKDRFQMTGTMHFFAISGLHIGVIATVIAQFLRLIRVPSKISPFIGLPLLYLYVEITGAAPSAVRAFLMALFFWMSFAFTRQRSPLAALAASAVFVLLIKPDQLWSIGFQLSYTVVLSILLFGLPLSQILTERLAPFRALPKPDWSRLQHIYAWALEFSLLLFAISVSAWLASAPLSAAFFGFFSPGAILLNMLLVNLAALAISTGVITLSLGLLGIENIAAFINHAAWLSIHLMDRCVIASTQIPGMIIACETFAKWVAYMGLAGYFIALFWLHHTRAQRSPVAWLLPPTVILLSLLMGITR
ncbi:ComEC/Rec2 family competence protein [Coraliomargarita sp. SDUM461004]|uniref:ComEC/Rec2 family competence protein n=1 Tax=Thalassobacterium sedimentorum TaxID=3041258 RepID=A0ABU1AN45_9BACT|nr:ComEC/Rec2 family competence protein [Coraliomargarita sp. SDUM461004]MDQ8195186.1 ComEC/Rec2 family competence protein [Coraliomargarita sp. SDUM461004]